MAALIYILISAIIASFISFIGIITLFIKEKSLDKIVMILVALSAGTLMGGAFLHLFPEGSKQIGALNFSIIFLISFSLFFLLERLLKWHHCHKKKCKIHTVGYMNLVGDGVHNFTDGLIIAGSYMIDINLGMVSTIGIISHEIPQEIGDYGVLIYSGFSRLKALTYNFIVSLTCVLGALVGYFILGGFKNIIPLLLPLAAGSFVYIASSDLVPELHKEKSLKKSLISFTVFIIGILIMYGIKIIFG